MGFRLRASGLGTSVKKATHDMARVAVVVLVVAVASAAPVHGGQPAETSESVALPGTIPLFPLQDVMLFPDISRQFHIFEPRYRAMVADALGGDRIIGMVLLQPGYEDEYEGRPPIFAVGCAGVIDDVEMFADGRYNIVLKGLTKFRILREDDTQPYRLADVEALPETLDADTRARLRARRGDLEAAFAARTPDASPPPTNLTDEDLVNGLAQFLTLDPLERQQLLEADGVVPRAQALIDLMRRDAPPQP